MIALTEALVSPHVLALPNSTAHMALDTEACKKKVRIVLLQIQKEETARPIEYWSPTLNDAQKKCDTTQWKRLAIVCSVLILRSFLKGTRFTIRTYQDSIERFLHLTNSTGGLARWRLLISEQDFDVIHVAWIKSKAADEFSGLRTTGEYGTYLDDDLPLLALDERKHGKQIIHKAAIYGNEEIPLGATDE